MTLGVKRRKQKQKTGRVKILGVASFLQYKFQYCYNLPIFLNKILKTRYTNLEILNIDFHIENIFDFLRYEVKKLENQSSKIKEHEKLLILKEHYLQYKGYSDIDEIM